MLFFPVLSLMDFSDVVMFSVLLFSEGQTSDRHLEQLLQIAEINGFSPIAQMYVQKVIEGIHSYIHLSLIITNAVLIYACTHTHTHVRF